MKSTDYTELFYIPLLIIMGLLLITTIIFFNYIEIRVATMLLLLYLYAIITTKALFKKWILLPVYSSQGSKYLSIILFTIFVLIIYTSILSYQSGLIKYSLFILLIIVVFIPLSTLIRDILVKLEEFKKTTSQIKELYINVQEIFMVTSYLDKILRPKITDEQFILLDEAGISIHPKLGETIRRNELEKYVEIMLSMSKETLKTLINQPGAFEKEGNNKYLRASVDKFITDRQNKAITAYYDNFCEKSKNYKKNI